MKTIKAISDDCCTLWNEFEESRSETIKRILVNFKHIFIQLWSKLGIHIFMFTIFCLSKHLYRKITKLEISSFYMQKTLIIFALNRKNLIFLRFYIFWSLKKMPKWKNYSIQTFKKNDCLFGKISLRFILRDMLFKSIITYHILMFKNLWS